MARIAEQVLIFADDEPSLGVLELALLRHGANVLRASSQGRMPVLEQTELDVVVVDPARIDPRAGPLLEPSASPPALVAWVRDTSEVTLRAAMAAGACDFLVRPVSQDGDAEAERLLALAGRRRKRGGQRRIREAEAIHRLKQQVRELTDRYVRQCRTFDEAQDVFYLDLSRMMTIFDNIMDGIVFTDPEGQVTLMNPVAEDLLGVRTIFAIGRCVRDLGHGSELIDEIAKEHERALIDGGVSERTLEIQHRGQELLYLKLRTTAVTDYKGSFAGILTVIKDVSAEYKSEQMKNQYLSIVSHELRTPLTGIKTFATLMVKGSLGQLPPPQQRVMDSIREQTLRLEHEIDKLICLGRIESGDFAMDREAFALVDLLDSVSKPFEQLARDRGIDFLVERPATSPWIFADREDLRRAIQALVENAVKFTPSGGRVEIFLCEHDDEVAVHVRDTGPGVSPRYHGRIFEKFFQVEDPLTRQHGGAGLGLCVAQGVARAHNGRIEVRSDLGRGAEFRIYLPKLQETPRERVESDQAEAAAIRKEP